MRAPARRRPESRFGAALLTSIPHYWNPLAAGSFAVPSGRVRLRAVFANAKTSLLPSIPDKRHAGGFFSGLNFLRKYGQNWNRTSDTRIFSLPQPLPSLTFGYLRSPKTARVYRELSIFSMICWRSKVNSGNLRKSATTAILRQFFQGYYKRAQMLS